MIQSYIKSLYPLLLLGWAASLSAVVRPQSDLHFERISVEHGLSQSTVNAIIQDHRGYMWFGTLNGLNRFDGYTFIDYRHNPNDTTSISNDPVVNQLRCRQEPGIAPGN